MKKRLFILIVLVLGFVIVTTHLSEPRYQGKSLTEWIEKAQNAYNHYVLTQNNPDNERHPEQNPEWRECQTAVKAMGSSTIPLLLKWIQAEDSAPKIKLIRWLRRKNWDERLHIFRGSGDPAFQKHINAATGFSLLRSDARPAFSTLIEMTKSKNQERRLWGFIGFASARPEKETFIPVAASLLHDNYYDLRSSAAQCLYYEYPDEAKRLGVCEIDPGLCNTNAIVHEMLGVQK